MAVNVLENTSEGGGCVQDDIRLDRKVNRLIN